MDKKFVAGFSATPATTFIVNVINAHEGKQDEAFAIIQDVVHYVSERKAGFLWSTLSKSTDGLTVVNIEAIQGAGNVDEFFSDPVLSRNSKKSTLFRRASFILILLMISCCLSLVRRNERDVRHIC